MNELYDRLPLRRTEVIRYWLPALFWSGILILSSGARGSAGRSGGLLLWVLSMTVGDVDAGQLYILNFVIRKAIHVLAYGLLGALHFRAVRGPQSGWNVRWAVTALLLSAVVAATDEYHQSLVPMRSGTVSDFLLDISAAAGVLITWMLSSRR